MSLEPQKHLEKALAKLHSAKILLRHGMYDDAASRAYYTYLAKKLPILIAR
ncbi:MAG: HEPN domain-containing protein [Candidatus Methanomethylicaceae archaeon]